MLLGGQLAGRQDPQATGNVGGDRLGHVDVDAGGDGRAGVLGPNPGGTMQAMASTPLSISLR